MTIILYDTVKPTYDAASKEVPLSNSAEEELSQTITYITEINRAREAQNISFEVMLEEYLLNGLISKENADLVLEQKEKMVKGLIYRVIVFEKEM